MQSNTAVAIGGGIVLAGAVGLSRTLMNGYQQEVAATFHRLRNEFRETCRAGSLFPGFGSGGIAALFVMASCRISHLDPRSVSADVHRCLAGRPDEFGTVTAWSVARNGRTLVGNCIKERNAKAHHTTIRWALYVAARLFTMAVAAYVLEVIWLAATRDRAEIAPLVGPAAGNALAALGAAAAAKAFRHHRPDNARIFFVMVGGAMAVSGSLGMAWSTVDPEIRTLGHLGLVIAGGFVACWANLASIDGHPTSLCRAFAGVGSVGFFVVFVVTAWEVLTSPIAGPIRAANTFGAFGWLILGTGLATVAICGKSIGVGTGNCLNHDVTCAC